MQVVVGRIVEECAENSPTYKLNNTPAINYNSMIPTKDNDYCNSPKNDNSSQESVNYYLLYFNYRGLINNISFPP